MQIAKQSQWRLICRRLYVVIRVSPFVILPAIICSMTILHCDQTLSIGRGKLVTEIGIHPNEVNLNVCHYTQEVIKAVRRKAKLAFIRRQGFGWLVGPVRGSQYSFLGLTFGWKEADYDDEPTIFFRELYVWIPPGAFVSLLGAFLTIEAIRVWRLRIRKRQRQRGFTVVLRNSAESEGTERFPYS